MTSRAMSLSAAPLIDRRRTLLGRQCPGISGVIDVDALEACLKANPGIAPDPAPRVMRLN